MGIKFKLTIDLNLAGQRFVLASDYGVSNRDGTQTDPEKELRFSGRTVGLNLNLTEILIDLAHKVNIDVKELVQEEYIPRLIIKDIYASFEQNSGEINFITLGSIYEKEVQFIFHYAPKRESKPSTYAFGVISDFDDLTGFPMIGKELEDVEFNGLGFMYTSSAEKYKLPVLSSPSGNEARKLTFPDKEKSYGKGFNFDGDLIYLKGEDPISLSLPITTSETKAKAKKETAIVAKNPSLQPNTKWFKLNKNMGPVTLGQVGFRYKSGTLILLLSGDVNFAALKLSLNGLGVGFETTKLFKKEFKPSFYLDGIGLSYKAPPIEVSGSFIRMQEVVNEGKKDEETIDVYNGGAVIKASKFTISAIGSYAKYKAEASLFIYGVYDGPIGGPAFFFVTGLAAGFGYNRRVNIPSMEEIADFPLVALAMNPQKDGGINDVIASLSIPMKNGKTPLEISLGDYWLAIGIKFTSFKLIESFLLLIVEMGNRLVFNILGLSVLRWPDKSLLETPIVNIELALKITFGPDSDVIAVQSIITPNSYVLDKSVKLAGGFAFFTWISGKHEGDFVITLGGYHSKFKKPAHYPNVDRLSLNWKLDKFPLTVRGELYFALTPKAIMAGGRWEVTYDIGFLKAYLIIWADMLIQWAPFQYFINAGIRIGIQAKIKVLFVVVRFKLEIGAQLKIWGPPFAGEVFVDWSIFSFTIPFGDSAKKSPDPLLWKEFHDSFIPQVNDSPHPLDTKIQDGIIKKIKDENGKLITTIVNPYDLVIAANSFFPLKEIYTDTTENEPLHDSTLTSLSDSDFPGAYKSYSNKAYGIKPMGVTQLNTNLHASLMKEGEAEQAPLIVTEEIAYMVNAKGMPSALWDKDSSEENPDVIPSAVAGVELHTTEDVDPTIVTIEIDKYDLRKKSKSAMFYSNEDALGQLTKEVINERISKNINNPTQTKIQEDLSALGFELASSDSLVFDEIGMDTPIYLASVGQKIPKIIVN